MKRIYIEQIDHTDLIDQIDEVIQNAQTISDRTNKRTLLKVGSGFDIETSRVSPNLAYCYHWQFGFHDLCIMGRCLDTMYEFLDILCWRLEELTDNVKLMVLDANLGYEWQFCKHYWANLGITKIFAKEKRDPIEIIVKDRIIFREVIGLFGSSLSQIAKNYCNIPKLIGDLDYSKVRLSHTIMEEKEIDYCVRDVEILVILAETYIYENFYGNKKRMPYTKTGIVRDAIKKELGSALRQERRKIASWMPSEELYELFRVKLFKGGISGCNIMLMNKVLTNVVGADITSDYPYQILTKKFPMGAATECEPKEFCTKDIPYIAIIKFHKFRTKTSHALMSAHKVLNVEELKNNEQTILDNNRIQYGEYVELCINDVEFKSLKKAYKWDHAIVTHCWEFKEGYSRLPRHIRDVCIKQFMIKQALKAEHSETQEYRDAKEFVNSIFGMMCTALYMEEYVFFDELCDIDIKEDANGNKINKPYKECCEYLFLSPYWGFWITSFAREMLIDVITRFPKVVVQYDTDSVYFTDNGSEQAKGLREYLLKKNEQIRMTNSAWFFKEPLMMDIGTWDFTKQFKRFKGLGSKRYMYEKQDGTIKCVVTGCRKHKASYEGDPDEGKSTIELQNRFNNQKNHSNVDIFDFFSKTMKIDKEHSEKLCSLYVDDYCRVSPTDCDGNTETIEIPSCLVLEPIEFNMTVAGSHYNLMIAAQRLARNTQDRRVYDCWRELKKLSTLTMTPISELITTGS